MKRDINKSLSRTISLTVFFQEKDYEQLRIERFRRNITTSECLAQALNEMLEDQKIFSEVMRTSRIMCKLQSPKGVVRNIRIFLPMNLLIILNNIYQAELVSRDLIISQAFCLYAQRRKERKVVPVTPKLES